MPKGTGKRRIIQRATSQQLNKTQADHFMEMLNDASLHEIIEYYSNDCRQRDYPTCLTLSMFLRQVLCSDSSCQKAVNDHNIELLQQGKEPNSSFTGAYCTARMRLQQEMIEKLSHETGQRLTEGAPESWLWQGYRVKLVDGTTITLPDTPDNQEKYPQHDNQLEGIGFPLVRLVAVTCYSSGAILGVNMGPYKGKGTGEMSLFARLIDKFDGGDLMLADRYFASFFLVATMLQKGVEVLFEQHGARKTDFRRGKKLGPRDHLVTWKKPARPTAMSKEEYATYPAEISVREVKVGGKVLITTLRCPKITKKSALKSLYKNRWHIELDIRNVKTTLGMESLSCKTAAMCEKELWVYTLAYNLVRILMAGSAQQAGIEPRKISFKHAVQIWNSLVGLPEINLNGERRDVILKLVSQRKVGNRPDRVEPRAVKKRPKPFPRLQMSRQQARENIRRAADKNRAA